MSKNVSGFQRDSGTGIRAWSKKWLRTAGTAVAVVLGVGIIGTQSANAHDGVGRSSYGYRSGYGYGSGYGGDPYHYYTGPRNHHDGPHSAPHVGPHYHWLHGYHNGGHWQRHYEDHGRAGHLGYRPWRPH